MNRSDPRWDRSYSGYRDGRTAFALGAIVGPNGTLTELGL